LAAVTSSGAGAAAVLGGVGTVRRRDEKRREGAESGEGKAEAGVFFFLNFFCRGPLARPSAKIPFAEGQARLSAIFFYFFVF